jgi:hypothetical protein
LVISYKINKPSCLHGWFFAGSKQFWAGNLERSYFLRKLSNEVFFELCIAMISVPGLAISGVVGLLWCERFSTFTHFVHLAFGVSVPQHEFWYLLR